MFNFWTFWIFWTLSKMFKMIICPDIPNILFQSNSSSVGGAFAHCPLRHIMHSMLTTMIPNLVSKVLAMSKQKNSPLITSSDVCTMTSFLPSFPANYAKTKMNRWFTTRTRKKDWIRYLKNSVFNLIEFLVSHSPKMVKFCKSADRSILECGPITKFNAWVICMQNSKKKKLKICYHPI